MNLKNLFSYILLFVLIASCTINPPEPEIIQDPLAATLIFPEDNTECNEGTILSDSQSKVVFRWNSSEHTDSYEMILTNTSIADTTNFDTTTNSKEITLERGTSYEWQVISKSEQSQVTAASDKFQFYNAAPGIVNHVPFSAEALAPENESTITASSGKVTLQWEASDIDNDIKDYEVFFGTVQSQLDSKGLVVNSSFEVDVTSGVNYFWMIKTNDETDNSSSSEIFSFTVQ